MARGERCALLFLVLVIFGFLSVVAGSGPKVSTKTGDLEGVTKYLHNDSGVYDVFMGIPFVMALRTHDDRWSHPQPVQPWTGVLDASYFRPWCPQLLTKVYKLLGLTGEESEDCLTLNVYVPGGVKRAQASTLPVMVWVFGGAFQIGQAELYPAENLAVNGDVIVVTLNYRVGPLGFLSTGDRNAEGNYGLYDQTEALRWLQENIEHFGGDKDCVTIFGQSAGGASVSHLSVSPLTQTLFKRAISMSGSSTAYFGVAHDGPAATQQLAAMLTCLRPTSAGILRCLKKRASKLLNVASLAAPFLLGFRVPLSWIPRVDGYLVSEEPRDAMEAGWSKQHDILVGNAQDDASFVVYLNMLGLNQGNLLNWAKRPLICRWVFKLILSPFFNGEDLAEMIEAQYPTMFDSDGEVRTRTLVKLLTDYMFAAPASLDAELHSRAAQKTKASTYLYEFSYRQSFIQHEPWITSSHLDDMYSVFGPVFMDIFRSKILQRPYMPKDQEMSEIVQKYFANFAYTGNPNEGPHKMSTVWPEFNEASRQLMQLKLKPEVISEDSERLAANDFWNDKFYRAAVWKTPEDFNIWDVIDNWKDVFEKVRDFISEMESRIENGEDVASIIARMMDAFEEWLEQNRSATFS